MRMNHALIKTLGREMKRTRRKLRAKRIKEVQKCFRMNGLGTR